jgi:hypothetical protein
MSRVERMLHYCSLEPEAPLRADGGDADEVRAWQAECCVGN